MIMQAEETCSCGHLRQLVHDDGTNGRAWTGWWCSMCGMQCISCACTMVCISELEAAVDSTTIDAGLVAPAETEVAKIYWCPSCKKEYLLEVEAA